MATDWELEALDPDTGEPLARVELGGHGRRRRTRRAVRLWWAAGGLGVFALFFAYAAVYTVRAQSSLRRLERTWRTIVAYDDSRLRADEMLARDGDNGNEDFARRSEHQVATEEVRLIGPHVMRLRTMHLSNTRSKHMRAAMVQGASELAAALDSNPIASSSRLGAVSLQLEAELHRWHLTAQPLRGPPELPRTRSLPTELSWYSPEPTGVVLMALTGNELITIDIDHNVTLRRSLITSPTASLFGTPDHVVVFDSGIATAYGPDPSNPPQREDALDSVGPFTTTYPVSSEGGRFAYWIIDHDGRPWIVQRSASTGELARLRVDVPGVRSIAAVG